MKEWTLGLLYVTKYIELLFLIILTGLVVSSGISYIVLITERPIDSKDEMNIAMTAVCLALAAFNLFYNNLLINLRFLAKMKCVTFGLCCFDAVNYLFCYCCLVKSCKDRCFTPWSIIKWLVKAGIMGFTIYLVREKSDEWEA